jgi:hypothetical protein
MAETTNPSPLFPAIERFVERTGLLANAKGILAARLPRILGQGQTRAEGLDMPPATIERQQELLALSLPDDAARDPHVQAEIAAARQAVAAHVEQMRNPDFRRRFALQILQRLEGVPTGVKDNHFYAGRLVLVPDKGGQNWAWSMTPHYPVIEKVPADIDYVIAAFSASEGIAERWTLPVERFVDRLSLAWSIAHHFGDGENVFIADVARVFKVAAQDERFWSNPYRRNFNDVPDAVFIANLINWRRHRDEAGLGDTFELVPATLNQAHGPRARAYYVPSNFEGTTVRPMIYLRRRPN